jgi:hypothetical protein
VGRNQRLCISLGNGQQNHKFGSFPHLTLSPDMTTVRINNLFDNRQSKTSSSTPTPAFVDLVESFENSIQIIGRNTDAGIGNADFYKGTAFRTDGSIARVCPRF